MWVKVYTTMLCQLLQNFKNDIITCWTGLFIGEGQFGKVYSAVNMDTGELMAMKEVRSEYIRSEKSPWKTVNTLINLIGNMLAINVCVYLVHI